MPKNVGFGVICRMVQNQIDLFVSALIISDMYLIFSMKLMNVVVNPRHVKGSIYLSFAF